MTTQEQIVFMQFLRKHHIIRRYKRAVENYLRTSSNILKVKTFDEHMALLLPEYGISAAFTWSLEKGYPEDKDSMKFWNNLDNKWKIIVKLYKFKKLTNP